jgi:hypothetical protein
MTNLEERRAAGFPGGQAGTGHYITKLQTVHSRYKAVGLDMLALKFYIMSVVKLGRPDVRDGMT